VPATESASPRPWTIRDAVTPGVDAVRTTWRPFIIIQVAAVVLVFAYYRSSGLQEAASKLAAFKVAGGIWFAFGAGAIAGGIVPEFAKALSRTLPKLDKWWALEVAHTAAVFGVVGILVDLFYKGQGMLFGTGIDPQTLLYKTLLDMGAFAPLFCIPLEVATLEWGHHRYRMKVLFQNLTPLAYRDRVLPVVVPCWAFWTPVLLCVYALPPDLQFPFAILAEAAWSIIIVCVTKRPQSH
jgi:hypothetical protein